VTNPAVEIRPEWRTENVVGVCLSVRETRDYSALPVLADALQDAGCDGGELLAALRDPELPPWAAERLVALVYSAETEAAVRAVEEFAAELGPRAFVEEGDGYDEPRPTTYERLMRVGDRWTADDDRWDRGHTVEHGHDNLRSEYSYGAFARFWEAYRLITGRAGEGNPFSCTC
jgi:hypothetical protein